MLKPNHVYIEVSHNQSGGLSLCVSNDDYGYRISGDKVGGCKTLARFEVDASELIEKIREHANTEGGRQMSKQIELSNAALVFTDAITGQGYIRTLNETEAILISAQLSAFDDGELKAIPVHPVQIRKMRKERAA
ncbi:hypothetical protein P4O20_003432 [Klebsiella pneumoniae]